MGFERGRKERNSSSLKNRERLLTLDSLQHKSPCGHTSTVRAPSSDIVMSPLQDMDLNIHMSNGRTHTDWHPVGVSITELVFSISCLSAMDCDLQVYKIMGCKTWNCI